MSFDASGMDSGREMTASVARLTAALCELRQAAISGDMSDLLVTTSALEDAAAELTSMAVRCEQERTTPRDGVGPDGSIGSIGQPRSPVLSNAQFWADLLRLKQEHMRTRQLLLNAIELTKHHRGRLFRGLGYDASFLPTALPVFAFGPAKSA